MSRIRTIKPEWLDDEFMLLASPCARVLSVALIVLADDEGRGSANPITVAGRVFPSDPSAFEPALTELRPWFVRLYRARGQTFFEINNWKKHQRIDRPSPAKTPNPSEGQYIDEASPVGVSGSANVRRTIDEGSGESRASRDPDPLPSDPGLGPDPTRVDPFGASFARPHTDDLWVFQRWAARFGKVGAKFDDRRGRQIAERRLAGMTRQDAEDALVGASFDAYVIGKKDGQRHDRLSFIFGDQERFEEFRDVGKNYRETGVRPDVSGSRDGLKSRVEAMEKEAVA